MSVPPSPHLPIILTPKTEVNHNKNDAFELNLNKINIKYKFFEWQVMEDIFRICRNRLDGKFLINMSESSCDFC